MDYNLKAGYIINSSIMTRSKKEYKDTGTERLELMVLETCKRLSFNAHILRVKWEAAV